nr:MAG TPA: hypothetical protein [Caudoviricetes sp.]
MYSVINSSYEAKQHSTTATPSLTSKSLTQIELAP